jgi:hypothetical protein
LIWNNRRSVLKAAIAAPVAALAGKAAVAGTMPRRVFLYDAAAPLADFYASIADTSVETIMLTDDLAAAWHHLDRRLADQPFALAGVTTQSQLFCIRILANGRRLQAAEPGAAPTSIAAASAALRAREPRLSPAPHDAQHIFWSFAPIARIA